MARLIPSLFVAAALAVLPVLQAEAEVPVVTDSRIKTFVYNSNEVFTVTTHYGYQSNIEFGDREQIETVSVGDRIAWQIIPAGRRLFIRAQEENAHTNMTVVTNKRAYQFDLRSSSADAVFGSEQLTYVVRFFYPGEANSAPVSYVPAAPVMAPAMPMNATVAAPSPMPMPVMQEATTPLNFRYTYSGSNQAAPVKIYDDGRSTFFKFNGAPIPSFSVITAKGEELAVPSRRVDANTYAVDVVAPR